MLALATLCSLLLISHSSAQIPPSLRTYSSSFAEPLPPLINAEFRCNYNQHKWYRFTESSDSNMTLPCQVFSLYSSLRRDQNVSHVASGFLYNSAAQQKVRADVVFDGSLGSSLFDFAKTTPDGLVENSVYLFTPSVAAKPSCNVYQVNSDFPLVPSDFLVANNAVFAGYQEDSMNGLVSLVSWLLDYFRILLRS